MIKKMILSVILCLFSSAKINSQNRIKINLSSKKENQISPVVKENVEEYAAKINTIIQEEKLSMEAELNILKGKNLEKTEFDTQKTVISERFAAKIDQKIEDLGFDLDSVIQKQVRYSLLNTDVVSDEELKNNLIKKFRATRELTAYISYGIMTLTNDLPDTDLDRNMDYSSNLEVGLKLNYQFSMTSRWGFISGVGLSWRTLRLDNNKVFAKDLNGLVSVDSYLGNTNKSKLRTGYLLVPVGLQYNFSKVKNAGMDVEYRSFSRGLRIAANIYGGVKMSSNNIVSGSGDEFRNRSNYQVNPLVYGGQVTLSYNSLSIFVKKDFSNYFKDSTFKNDKALVIGLGLGL